MKVQLLDLASQYRKIRKEVLKEVKTVCDSQHYVLGKNVSGLEGEIAAYCGAKFAVGVASGTDAILLALMAAGVKAGDKVVTTPFTFFATAGSIARLGAVPLFVDIDPETYNIDPVKLENLLRKKGKGVKAIIPVHLYGQCADMDPIMKAARRHRVPVIEDAAQSIGAKYKGRRAGSIGDLGCLSFYPTKNLGCFGDGGMVTTNSPKLAERLKMLRVHGSRVRYYHDEVGLNSRLDELQAAILRVKLKYLDAWAAGREKNAGRYDSLFKRANIGGVLSIPRIQDGNRSVYNQYVIRVEKRDALRGHLTGLGVGSEVYYPLPLHMQKCFKGLGYKKGDFPVSEAAAREVLALPIYPELTSTQQKHVVLSIAGFYGKP
ncbi:MAG TPA: transcriptional regulator [Deltaproteobacteria bacterium]|nr:MAG: transcriptional regulator [Deltaproteobacteria bacterium GWA2_55_82]OGQ65223.1 MAG: transcriptional regulator [Deltaproteobacteria bacterium RIFCSPLOWO2_02_FULL_55_12]OIJ74783.1 MAG: transcriptional regulator [Deltaproteobacteria bacterium GWC2_55_46]HBG45713.1 transcriptional regulator [Deltaproteobacteria bacterium]HCY11121.1 transcriptional regulator [Deltaproteobacteria bacterium]